MKPIAVSASCQEGNTARREKPHPSAGETSHFVPPASTLPSKAAVPEPPRPVGPFAKVAAQDWAPALLLFIADIICWIAVYGSLILFRRDLFFSSGFLFVVIKLITLAVIVHALFIVGGYSFRTEMRGLAYTAEHILAMFAALAISSLFLYAAATFDKNEMKPGRGSILSGFILFTPMSLLYRRALRRRGADASANRAF